MNLETVKPSLAGISGIGLLQIPEQSGSNITEIVIAVVTVLFQVLTFFKKKKSV